MQSEKNCAESQHRLCLEYEILTKNYNQRRVGINKSISCVKKKTVHITSGEYHIAPWLSFIKLFSCLIKYIGWKWVHFHVTPVQITNSVCMPPKLPLSWVSVIFFLFTLLTSNNMISLTIWCKKEVNFSKTANCSFLTGLCNSVVFEKFTCAY